MLTTDIVAAAAKLRAGGVVAMPTETVYGLAGDATDPAAIERIYKIKGRPSGHPLIVHFADPDDAAAQIPDWSSSASALGAAWWPGPLTIIVSRPRSLPAVVAGGLNTVGIRVPAHPVARRLIKFAGVPVAAPSANLFGSVSPTTAAHVAADLKGRLNPDLDAILDGGPTEVGVESTIVDCVADPPQILRAGAITTEQIAELLGEIADPAGPARVSGMFASHYAPKCQIRLSDRYDAGALHARTPGSRILDETSDLATYARRLYAEMRRADDDGISTLIAVLPEPVGLGRAICDRLTKAAAPRPTGS